VIPAKLRIFAGLINGKKTYLRTGILYNNEQRRDMTETTYTNLRQSLASVLDRVGDDREVVIVVRKGERKVALVPADELAGLIETAHFAAVTKNAQRLLTVLRRAVGRRAVRTMEKLRREMGLAPAPLNGKRSFILSFGKTCAIGSNRPAGVAIRAFDLIEKLSSADPFVGIGKPEPLKVLNWRAAGPRRITQAPLVYSVKRTANRFSAGAGTAS